MTTRRSLAGTLITGGVLAVALAAAWSSAAAAAAGPSLWIDPPVVRVQQQASFTVRVLQDASVPTAGAEATILFDPAILQVESVTPGSAYASAPIFLPKDLAAAAAKANRTGRLATIAGALTPPTTVPAGQAEFLRVRFRVVGCGSSALQLPVGAAVDGVMLDGRSDRYGLQLDVTTLPGQVTTCVAAGAATTDPPEPAAAATSGDSTPPPPIAGLAIAAAALAAVAFLGGLARRSRPDDRLTRRETR